MRSYVCFVVASLALLVIAQGARADEQWGTACDGVQLKAEARDTKVARGEEVEIVLTIKNVSETDRLLPETTPIRDFTLVVVNGKGELIQPYRHPSNLDATRFMMTTLKPGEERRFTYALHYTYKLEAPETYTITASREVPVRSGKGHSTITSNPTTITVEVGGPPPIPSLHQVTTENISLDASHITVVDKKEQPAEMSIVLQKTVYEMDVRAVASKPAEARSLTCYELTSADPARPYSWSMWSYNSLRMLRYHPERSRRVVPKPPGVTYAARVTEVENGRGSMTPTRNAEQRPRNAEQRPRHP